MTPNPKSRKQAEKRLPSLAVSPPKPAWATELDLGPTETKERVVYAWCPDPEWDLQVVQREVRDVYSGQLRDFAVQLEAQAADGSGWLLVERVDCAHGEVHIDRGYRSGRTTKDWDRVPPNVQDSLDAALVWAVEYIWNTTERWGEWT